MSTVFDDLHACIQQWRAERNEMVCGSLFSFEHADPQTEQQVALSALINNFKLWAFGSTMRRFDIDAGRTSSSALILRSLLLSRFLTVISIKRGSKKSNESFIPVPWALYTPSGPDHKWSFVTKCGTCNKREVSTAAWRKTSFNQHSGARLGDGDYNPFKPKHCDSGLETIFCVNVNQESKNGKVSVCTGTCKPLAVQVPGVGPDHYPGFLLKFDEVFQVRGLQKRFEKEVDGDISALVEAAMVDSDVSRAKFIRILKAIDRASPNESHSPVKYTTFVFSCSFIHPTQFVCHVLRGALQVYAARLQIWSDQRTTRGELTVLRRLFVRVDLHKPEALYAFTTFVLASWSRMALSMSSFQCIGATKEESEYPLAPVVEGCAKLPCRCAYDLVEDSSRKRKEPEPPTV